MSETASVAPASPGAMTERYKMAGAIIDFGRAFAYKRMIGSSIPFVIMLEWVFGTVNLGSRTSSHGSIDATLDAVTLPVDLA
jgi:hypothetical protein